MHAVDPGDGLNGVIGAAALKELVAAHQPDLILFAQSYDGRDAIARHAEEGGKARLIPTSPRP